jgi:hypothetical protein
MPLPDPIVEAYLAKVAPFAQPIVRRFSDVVLGADDRITSAIKWGHLSFEYKGILCGIATFKRHVSWGFWKGKLLKVPERLGMERTTTSFMSGDSIVDASALPSAKLLRDLVKQAIALNEASDGVPKPKREKQPLRVPADLKAALAKDSRAAERFEAMLPSHRREYVDWIVGAKKPETRERRIATTVSWVRQGKTQNWRYEKPRSGAARA